MTLFEWMADASFYMNFYKDIRAGCFTGFLTISGFLYAAHTFIVVHMKKEMYDQQWYRDHLAKLRTLNSAHSHYGALRRLSRTLMTAISVAALTSLCQITIGAFQHNWAALLCLLCVALSFGFLIWCIVLMTLNLRSWFDSLDATVK